MARRYVRRYARVTHACRKDTIITRDGGYATKYGGDLFLNAALYQDLARLKAIGQRVVEVFCYDNIPEGISHFAATVHVSADTLPTEAETEEIKKQQEALPPLSRTRRVGGRQSESWAGVPVRVGSSSRPS